MDAKDISKVREGLDGITNLLRGLTFEIQDIIGTVGQLEFELYAIERKMRDGE